MALAEGAMRGSEISRGGRGQAVSRDGSGRLPAGVALGFATLSHSNLKSYAKIEAAQGHNTRARPTPNARDDGPAPVELLDDRSGSYVDRVKAVLAAHGKEGSPIKPRKNGVLACEDIYGASPEYWDRHGPWRDQRTEELIQDPVIQAALALAKRKHGARLVSCSLHLDEASPHIHVVSVPLVLREHSKRGRKPKNLPRNEAGQVIEDDRTKVMKWTLDASSLRGRSSDLERNHDEWAEECKDFGLVRGAKGSEMTEEARRARRSRQTGRSSQPEANARKERERLHRVAEDHEIAANKKDEEAANELRTAKLRRKEADAALERAMAQERENQQIRSQLDEQKRKLEKTKKDDAEAIKKQRSLLKNQVSLINKLLDPSRPLEIQLTDRGADLRGLDAKDQSAIQGSWAWLRGGLMSVIDRVSELLDRESSLERAGRMNDAMVRILEKVAMPDSRVTFQKENDNIESAALSHYENGVIRMAPQWFQKSVIRISSSLRFLTGLEEREQAIITREANASRLENELCSEREEIECVWTEYEKITGAMERSRVRALDFLKAFKDIPEDQLTPKVVAAIESATELENDQDFSAYLADKKAKGVD